MSIDKTLASSIVLMSVNTMARAIIGYVHGEGLCNDVALCNDVLYNYILMGNTKLPPSM